MKREKRKENRVPKDMTLPGQPEELSIDMIEHLHYTIKSTDEMSFHFKRAYDLAVDSKSDQLKARSAFLLGAYYESIDFQKASNYYKESHQIALQLNDSRMLSDTLHGVALPLIKAGKFEEARQLELEALELAKKAGHSYRIAFTHYILSTIAIAYGAYEEGISYMHNALEISKKHNFAKLQVQIYDRLSELYLGLNEPEKAETLAKQSISVGVEISMPERNLLRSQIRLSTIRIAMGKYHEAEKFISHFFKKENSDNVDKTLLATAYTVQGEILKHKRKYKEAEESLWNALLSIKELHRYKIESNIYAQLADLFDAKDKVRSALNYAKEAYTLAEKAKDSFIIKEALNLLYQYSKKLNKTKDALSYLEEYNRINGVSNSTLLKNRLEYFELRTNYEQQRSQLLEQERTKEMLRLELEHKERELTEKTRHLIKQTEAVAQFRDDLRALIRRTPSDDPIVKTIKERLSNEPDKHLSWLEFEEEFKKVHPDYVVKLRDTYPMLTKMEQKICMMLRIGLTSVDIAKLLFLSERNIENHRYRIRKKLCLNSEVSLHEFLAKV